MKTNLKNQLLHRVSLLGKSLQYTAAASLIALSSAHAAVIDWKSNAGSVTWVTGTNWVGDTAPVKDLTTDIARFNQTSYAFQPQATVADIISVPPVTSGEINGIQSGDGTTVTAALTLSTGAGINRLNLGNSGVVMYANSGALTFGALTKGSQGLTILADQSWVNNSASLFTVNSFAVDNASAANPVLTLSGSGAGGYSFGAIEASNLGTGSVTLRFNRTGAGPIALTSNTVVLKGFQIGDGVTATVAHILTTGVNNNRLLVGDGGIVKYANSGAFAIGATGAGSQGVTFVDNQIWQNNSSSLLTVNSFAVDNASSANPVLTLSGSGTGGYSLGKIENSTVTAPQVAGVLSLIVNMNGAGVVDLTGNSTFTGSTTLTAGTLLLTHNSALGTGTFTINGGTITSSASSRTSANPQVWGGDWTFGGANNWTAGVSTVNMTGNRTVTVSGAGIPSVNSVISGTGDLTKAGSGTLSLGNSNSYVGKTIVREGTLQIDFGTNSVAQSSGSQSNKAPVTSPLEVGGGTVSVSGGNNRPAWAVVAPTAWTAVTPSATVADRYDLTFTTLPAVAVGQPVTGTGIIGGIVQAVSTTLNTVTIDVTAGSPAPAATGTDFAASAIASSWSAVVTTGLPAGQYQLTFASSIAVTPGQPVTATGLTGAYVVRTSGTTIIVASSTVPAATGTDFALVTFNPSSAQTFASTALTSGASTITASLNNGTGVKADLGAITRAVGSTVQLNSSGTLSATNGILTSNGSASTTLLDSGVAYATAGANNWAAKDATNTWIESASNNLNDATTLGVPNSSAATLIDTVLAADSSPATMKSNIDETRTITASGFTITTSGVLAGSAVTASNGLTITGGTLKSAATSANKDLVMINNGAGSLTINSTIANSAAGVTGLTKSGTGTVVLGGYNVFTGSTIINKGTLSLTATNTLANASGVVIGSDSTAILNLNFVGTEYVASLTINGVVKADGNYTSSDPSGRITGGGTLTVGGTPPASPYDTWAAIYVPADVSNPAGDNDNDGLANQQEFAYGLDPLSGSSVNPILVQLDQTTGQFSYQRRSDTGLTYTVLKSTTLAAGSWSSASASQVAGAVDGNGNQTVVVTLPGAPLTEDKLFVRVSAE
jgi:autotransporter-associated beta strand protein